ncbi:prephenate dehydratase [Bizionia paragorgiae]|uniref:prephenate dehydratase n=1 Tax=Bizionia paragorgiae TaxID=283786 RepID=UPI00299EC194|nr:prephenate dehydratase [Bizionia paragorgiae]MDX1271269.1 prephenate dehydratase [Bizionia paragorgiae]
MPKTVAIQGIKGSFHHIVSQQYFETAVDVVECRSFQDTVAVVLNKQADMAIMAIENSIAGSIIPNYALIDSNNLQVVGEYYLDVQHHLMALPNQDIYAIKEVHSHPMALLQCAAFFKEYPHIKLVEAKDTAEVAKEIQSNQSHGIAAIASTLAAELFGLQILNTSIQTIKHNETRFVFVQRLLGQGTTQTLDKASIKFELEHKRGSLAAVLNVLSDCKINLTKIQSLPIIETPWKYAFFVDVTFDENKSFEKAKQILDLMTTHLKVIGVYKNAK